MNSAETAIRGRFAFLVAWGLAQLVLVLSTAGVFFWQGSPRLMVLAALPGLLALAWGAANIRALHRRVVEPAVPPLPSVQQLDRLQEQLARVESELEHAPVALWRWAQGRAWPINAAARRLAAATGELDAALWQRVLAPEAPHGQLVQLDTARGTERWLLAQRAIVVAGQAQRLLALQPLESELEAEHLRAQRQLVHVLTHEIMNSLTPIVSLSRSALEMQGDASQSQDQLLALQTVAQRAESLSRFVADYRKVSAWPEPELAPVDVEALFERLRLMVERDWLTAGGAAHFEVQGSPQLMADAGQLEQALLNLIRNARQATQAVAAPQLWVSARLHQSARLHITVRDNGPGVPQGLEADIFTPFFSARQRQGNEPGSGIGLAVVRQLVHGMGGAVRYAKHPSGGACFVLSF